MAWNNDLVAYYYFFNNNLSSLLTEIKKMKTEVWAGLFPQEEHRVFEEIQVNIQWVDKNAENLKKSLYFWEVNTICFTNILSKEIKVHIHISQEFSITSKRHLL